MKYFNKILSIFVVFVLILTGTLGGISINANADDYFELKLLAFPESYREPLRALHAIYPYWEFIADPVAYYFSDAVRTEEIYKQVQVYDDAVSWRSMAPGNYDWNNGTWLASVNGGWTGASREMIAYYLDPRNFLNSTEIYQFLEQSYNPNFQTRDGLVKVVANTFLAGSYLENGVYYNYVDVIMNAAWQANVNPYIIASKIIQEQGVDGASSLISGTYPGFEGYYNFFNVKASGATATDVIVNGLTYAKNNSWYTRELSIIGGAKFLAQNYIAKGQDTYYYQDFDIKVYDNNIHQYAQAVHDACNKGKNMSKTYINETFLSLSFKIPIFPALPDTPQLKPAKTSALNNYYFESISIPGLTPSFNKFTYNYNLHLTQDSTVFVTPVAGATYVGASSYYLNAGDNIVNLKVKSATGYVTDYVLNVHATVACTLNVSFETPPQTITVKGDANGDGIITIRDLADVRLHLLGLKTLAGNNLLSADVNVDGTITIRDLADIRLHLLGLKTIV